jgi:hypothetical protein
VKIVLAVLSREGGPVVGEFALPQAVVFNGANCVHPESASPRKADIPNPSLCELTRAWVFSGISYLEAKSCRRQVIPACEKWRCKATYLTQMPIQAASIGNIPMQQIRTKTTAPGKAQPPLDDKVARLIAGDEPPPWLLPFLQWLTVSFW